LIIHSIFRKLSARDLTLYPTNLTYQVHQRKLDLIVEYLQVKKFFLVQATNLSIYSEKAFLNENKILRDLLGVLGFWGGEFWPRSSRL
jgi:hypothetical protein